MCEEKENLIVSYSGHNFVQLDLKRGSTQKYILNFIKNEVHFTDYAN